MVLNAHVDIIVLFQIVYEMSYYLYKYTRYQLGLAYIYGN